MIDPQDLEVNWLFVGDNIRVMAVPDKWKVETQVRKDGEWWIKRRSSLRQGDQWDRASGKQVEKNLGMFTGLPTPARILLAPLYGLTFAYYCVIGLDINLQVLEDDS